MMLSFALSFCFIQLPIFCHAIPQSFSTHLPKRQDAPSSELPCLSVISAAAQGVYIFAASDVYDCISRVPFHADVASRFIDYYNDTLQFQSTLRYLNNPPDGYQQPSVDVQQELENIRADIVSGTYKTQYAFEEQIQVLISRIHDSHVTLDAGMLAAFKFASPYTLLSLSENGSEEPKIYLKEDLLAAAKEGYDASPVTKINSIEVIEYLTSLIAPNSEGYVEPHADWNSLLSSPAKDIQGYLSIFQRLPLYPGDELNFTFENNTSLDTIWLALYAENARTGPLTTPGDFYNYFVLGLIPAGFDPNDASSPPWWPADYNIPFEEYEAPSNPEPGFDCSNSAGPAVNWCNVTNGNIGAYPNDPVVVQNDMSITGAGAISGYIFDDISTGVLSIPSFYQDGLSVAYFFNAIDEFIGNATTKEIKRVVIDLQQNTGGLVLLAMTTFQQIFPELPLYTGSRIRSHRWADILGTAYTDWWQSLDPDSFESQDSAASEWIAVNRINAATGRNFASWSEYFGPVLDRNDAFSQKQLYKLSDEVFDYDMFGWTYQPWVNSSFVVANPGWNPDEIVLLTDGLCSSACALFVELMTELAGVRTITFGGRPQHGPMQTASGNRGAAAYTSNRIDYDIDNLKTLIGDEAAFNSIPPRNDTGIFTNYALFNLRDQMRPEDLTPLQFRYEASDCRLYYTPKNVYDMSQLWRDAATATWDDTTLCVPDSTNYSKRTRTQRKPPPKPNSQAFVHYTVSDIQLADPLEVSFNTSVGLMDSKTPPNLNTYQKCNSNSNICPASLVCAPAVASCNAVGDTTLYLCLQRCNTLQALAGDCKPQQLAQSTAQQPVVK
ncbi:hypothetical protein AA0111_g1964 [Alternaria arborescens]|uniref:hypothetical protein n=1 Tax=Alternaria arborescens TaxID=156630 RepID=UPI0010753EB8|nr:hypothetical protein AA0111_g1964 [Alternaria arborescens]RYO39302.1 hypothetical protein AA0111_g1964 [Alternaria arborescens]